MIIRKRDYQIQVRCTEAERDIIERAARAEGLNLSDWIRENIFLREMIVWDRSAMRVIRAEFRRRFLAEIARDGAKAIVKAG